MREYAVYDTKDNYLLVKVGNVYELAEYFGTTDRVIYSTISKNHKVKRRYEILKIEADDDE